MTETSFLNYTKAQEHVRNSGFDFVGGFYSHNLGGTVKGRFDFSHNLEWLAAEARRFISHSVEDEEPFFLYFAPTTPHLPDNYEAMTEYSVRATPAGWLDDDPESGMPSREKILAGPNVTEENAGYYWTDAAFGAIYEHLKALGQLDNTILVWAVDHGQNTKGALFDGGSRTPMAIRYPPLVPPGSRSSKLVSLVDLLPSFLYVVGADDPGFVMDGASVFPLQAKGRDVVYLELGVTRRSLHPNTR